VLAGAALLCTLFVMWATRPPSTCDMAAEPHRRLYLDRQLDREHLGRDAGEIQRVARRRATHAAAGGGSVFADCQDTLVHGVVAKHDVTVDQVLAAIAAER
jgi:hypothetical protein